MYPGQVVALTSCPCKFRIDTAENIDIKLSGLFVLDENYPYDPSSYIWEACWDLYSKNDDPPDADTVFYSVPHDVLVEQVEPKEHAKQLVLEREMEFAEEEWS
jgi:hypothetical protein